MCLNCLSLRAVFSVHFENTSCFLEMKTAQVALLDAEKCSNKDKSVARNKLLKKIWLPKSNPLKQNHIV